MGRKSSVCFGLLLVLGLCAVSGQAQSNSSSSGSGNTGIPIPKVDASLGTTFAVAVGVSTSFNFAYQFDLTEAIALLFDQLGNLLGIPFPANSLPGLIQSTASQIFEDPAAALNATNPSVEIDNTQTASVEEDIEVAIGFTTSFSTTGSVTLTDLFEALRMQIMDGLMRTGGGAGIFGGFQNSAQSAAGLNATGVNLGSGLGGLGSTGPSNMGTTGSANSTSSGAPPAIPVTYANGTTKMVQPWKFVHNVAPKNPTDKVTSPGKGARMFRRS